MYKTRNTFSAGDAKPIKHRGTCWGKGRGKKKGKGEEGRGKGMEKGRERKRLEKGEGKEKGKGKDKGKGLIPQQHCLIRERAVNNPRAPK